MSKGHTETLSEEFDKIDEMSSAKLQLNMYLSNTIHSPRVNKILQKRPQDFLGLKFRLERGKVQLKEYDEEATQEHQRLLQQHMQTISKTDGFIKNSNAFIPQKMKFNK